MERPPLFDQSNRRNRGHLIMFYGPPDSAGAKNRSTDMCDRVSEGALAMLAIDDSKLISNT